MEFKTRTSSIFIMNMFMIGLALSMTVYLFIIRDAGAIVKYVCALWLVFAAIRLRTYWRYLYLIFAKKAVLSVNESYIYDLAKDLKYFWEDINEVYENNGYLYLKLYNPADYINKLGGPIKRFAAQFISNQYNTPFVINIDMINANPDALLEIINDYSIKAMELEDNSQG